MGELVSSIAILGKESSALSQNELFKKFEVLPSPIYWQK